MKLGRISQLSALLLSLPVAGAAAQSLSPYDVFVFQNFSHTNSETNTRLAVGGNATMDHWAVGKFLPPNYSDYSFVVGGNLNSNEGSVAAGRTYIGGTRTETNTGYPAAYPPESGESPINFASEIVRLTGISNAYAALTPTGTTRLNDGVLEFIGNTSQNVFEVAIELLQQSTHGYAFVNPTGAYNVVNVIGSSATSAFNNNDGYFFDCTQEDNVSSCQSGTNFNTPSGAGRTVWNFNQQTDLNIGGPLHGNLLAPNADVTFGIGDVVGDVVVKSATSSAEYYSVADYSESVAPEPQTLALMATGLFGLVGAGRFRKRSRAVAA